MRDYEVKEWDYTMDGDTFEYIVERAKRVANNLCLKLYKKNIDYKKDKSCQKLKDIYQRIFKEKDKDEDYWNKEIEFYANKIIKKYNL